MSSDFPADVCLRPNSPVSEREPQEGGTFVGDQRKCLVVQENAQFSRRPNDVVPIAEVVAGLQDNTSKLKKNALAHQSFK